MERILLQGIFKNLSELLKKDGTLILSIPYNSGLHYLPHDYFRMSHYALRKLLNENKFEIMTLEPYYENNMNKIIRILKIRVKIILFLRFL